MTKKYVLTNGLQLIFKRVQDTYIQFGEGSHIKKPCSGHERTNFFKIDDFVRLWMAKTFPFYGKYQYQKGGGPLEKHPVDVIFLIEPNTSFIIFIVSDLLFQLLYKLAICALVTPLLWIIPACEIEVVISGNVSLCMN